MSEVSNTRAQDGEAQSAPDTTASGGRPVLLTHGKTRAVGGGGGLLVSVDQRGSGVGAGEDVTKIKSMVWVPDDEKVCHFELMIR